MKKQLQVLSIASFLTLSPTPALAAFGVDDIINALMSVFLGAVQKQSAGEASMLMGTLSSAADAMNDVQTGLFNKQLLLDFDPPPDMCVTTELQAAAVKSEQQIDATRASLSVSQTSTALTTDKVFKHIESRVDTHRSKYCTPEEAAKNLCGSGSTTSSMPGADVKAETLIKKKYDSEEEKQAAIDFIANAVNPVPTAKALKGTEDSPQGKALQAIMLAEAARLAVASLSLNQIMADRIEVPGGKGLSALEIMNEEADRRYLNDDWAAGLLKASPAGVAREQALMAAFALKMQVRMYEQNQRIEMLLSTIVAIEAKREASENAQKANQAVGHTIVK